MTANIWLEAANLALFTNATVVGFDEGIVAQLHKECGEILGAFSC